MIMKLKEVKVITISDNLYSLAINSIITLLKDKGKVFGTTLILLILSNNTLRNIVFSYGLVESLEREIYEDTYNFKSTYPYFCNEIANIIKTCYNQYSYRKFNRNDILEFFKQYINSRNHSLQAEFVILEFPTRLVLKMTTEDSEKIIDEILMLLNN
jgi:hypothetical protein